ncbi:hypothetical protein K9M79_08655 [Candidatus Woesearchaeota archaeon]|nr:hypothetical protein [Candidatus Woesearchaeota archaeon]
MKKSNYNWVFYLGLFAGLLMGVLGLAFRLNEYANYINAVIVILGFVYGGLLVNLKETEKIVIALILVLLSTPANVMYIPGIGNFLAKVLSSMTLFLAPMALAVGYRVLFKHIASK